MMMMKRNGFRIKMKPTTTMMMMMVMMMMVSVLKKAKEWRGSCFMSF